MDTQADLIAARGIVGERPKGQVVTYGAAQITAIDPETGAQDGLPIGLVSRTDVQFGLRRGRADADVAAHDGLVAGEVVPARPQGHIRGVDLLPHAVAEILELPGRALAAAAHQNR